MYRQRQISRSDCEISGNCGKILCSQGMFFPQLFGIVGEKLVFTRDHQYDDPEDLYDDRYLLEVRT